MLLVKTYIKLTKTMGMGLFSLLEIRPGSVIHIEDQYTNFQISNEDFDLCSTDFQNFISKYAYFRDESQSWYLSLDNVRFMNHSNTPNSHYNSKTGITTSITNIKPDEEITGDYKEFCDLCKRGDFGF